LLKEYQQVAIFSTGIPSVDDELKGGIFSSELSELYGYSGSGKTSLCHKICAQILVKSAKQSVIYADTTNCFSFGRLFEYIDVYLIFR